jgi:hypothetical protein
MGKQLMHAPHSRLVTYFVILSICIGLGICSCGGGGGGGGTSPKSEEPKILDKNIWSDHPRMVKEVTYDLKGSMLKYQTYTYNANGMLSRKVLYKGPGTDSQWVTNDDIVDTYSDVYSDSSAKENHEVFFMAQVLMTSGSP